MKTVLLVFGTRPEAIKMCPLVNELKKRADMRVQVCVTRQHWEMLDPILEAFHVVPDHDLGIMKPEQNLFDITDAVLRGMAEVLERAEPDIVLVHGDTTTAFAAALACYYKRIPVGHVEAGLRTYNIDAPYPEEFNRQAIDTISRLHFAPTERAAQTLLREGKDPSGVFVTGNTVIDALRQTVRADYTHPALDWADGSRLILLTAHRRENWGEPMRRMFRAIRRVIEEHPDTKLVYPVHPNPLVRGIAQEELSGAERIRLIDPLDVIAFHNFESRCYLCLTDSGGLQEECPSFGKPVLVMRELTERPEAVEAGTVKLVGTQEADIEREFTRLLEDAEEYDNMAKAVNPYGDGHACERIADILAAFPAGQDV